MKLDLADHGHLVWWFQKQIVDFDGFRGSWIVEAPLNQFATSVDDVSTAVRDIVHFGTIVWFDVQFAGGHVGRVGKS